LHSAGTSKYTGFLAARCVRHALVSVARRWEVRTQIVRRQYRCRYIVL